MMPPNGKGDHPSNSDPAGQQSRSNKKVQMDVSDSGLPQIDSKNKVDESSSPTKLKVTFKNARIGSPTESEEFLGEKTDSYDDVSDDDEDNGKENDIECPIIRVTKEEKKRLLNHWRNTLIIKLVEHMVGYNFLVCKLRTLWHI